jgi:hypothetical protein
LDSLSHDVQHPEHHVGVLGGLFYNTGLKRTAGLQVDVLLARRTLNDTFQSPGEVPVYYLQFPVQLRLNTGPSGRRHVTGFALLGPVFEIRLKGQPFPPGTRSTPYRDVGLAWTAAGGVEIGQFVVEARYTETLASSSRFTDLTIG